MSIEYKSVQLKFVTWHVKRERAITYHTLSPRANILKHVQNEFLINVAIFAQISDTLLHDNSAHSDFPALRKRESFEARAERERERACCLWARYFCWNSTHVSPALRNKKFNFKRSMVHTRDCLPRNTSYQAGESRYSTSTCGALRNHDFPGFPGASAFNSTVPLLHYLRALTTSRLKF